MVVLDAVKQPWFLCGLSEVCMFKDPKQLTNLKKKKKKMPGDSYGTVGPAIHLINFTPFSTAQSSHHIVSRLFSQITLHIPKWFLMSQKYLVNMPIFCCESSTKKQMDI